MKKSVLAGVMLLTACTAKQQVLKEIRLTSDNSKNHALDNNDNFSPDGKWLVYDTRTGVGGIGGSPSVERVNIETGKTEVLFGIPENKDWGP